jgi:hypothetical protein
MAFHQTIMAAWMQMALLSLKNPEFYGFCQTNARPIL